jgi:hypothetical protein
MLKGTSGQLLTRLLSHSRLATSERRLARGHWEDMRTYARRNRNIFQDPGNVDSELKVRDVLGVSQTSRIRLLTRYNVLPLRRACIVVVDSMTMRMMKGAMELQLSLTWCQRRLCGRRVVI